MLRINFYISGHGYGHATRSAQLVSALLAAFPTTEITIITTAPSHLFPISPRLSFIALPVDSAITQPQPYTINAPTSFANLRTFLSQAAAPEWRTRTSEILDSTGCNLILADAPYPCAWAGAKQRGVKSVLVSNFTFDAIFAGLFEYVKEAEGEGDERALVEQIKMLYATYDFVVRLPGYIDFPFVEEYWSEEDREVRIRDAPLVYRPARAEREDVLDALGVPVELRGNKILLVQFGGQILDSTGESKVSQLPDGWICFSSSPVADPQFFTFPKDVYSPDLVATADVVLGKIGYGTVSECVGMNKALVYVLRPMFAEEPGLLRYMEANGTCEEISVEDYESGSWATAVERVEKSHAASKHSMIEEGSAEVVRIIEELLRQG